MLSLHTRPNSWNHFASDHATLCNILPIMPGLPMLRTNGALANGRSQPMEMIREGLLRLWVICTILFLAAVGAWFYRPFEKEFHRAAFAGQIQSSATPLVPIACGEARGARGSDYLSDVDDANCWYALPKFRANYPEYARLADPELVTTMVRKVGWRGGPRRPWIPLLALGAIALAIPLIALLWGWAVLRLAERLYRHRRDIQ